MRVRLLIILSIILASASAQDAHYWTEQYGTRSMLLSNSVYGSVEDLGAVYYNPARLSFIEENAFLISGKVYQLSSYAFDTNTNGERTSPKRQSSFGGAPSLLAGTYRVKGWDKHSFAYSFLGRRNMDISLTESSSTYGDVLPILPGEEYFSGDVYLQKKFNEEWFGLSWSFAPNERFSIGLSNFLTIRKQNALDETQIYAYTEAQDVESYKNNNSYSFSHAGVLWKIGLAWNLDPITCGITITTPMVSLSGNGSFNYDYVYTGINEANPIYERNKQNDLDMTYKTPFSIAGGVGVNIKRNSIHASAEYFGAISEYTLMTSEPFTGQSTNTEYQAVLVDKLKPVLNFGIGYNFVFSDALYGYISYSTDFSAASATVNEGDIFRAKTYASTFKSNINHFGGGVVMHLKRADITLGASLATTDYRIKRSLVFPEDGNSGIFDPDAYTDVHWNRWRFIVGVSIPFLNDFAKKWEDKLLNNGDKAN
ncbi:hypothetical protein KDU71_06335 [Carboxylicivirga sediminis]|uniref:Long-chain fatty acid transport protein n=1 Tax=Carboxylicivirga sediminis TaxID=2006564 RepID=A0A941IX91_9BACT|nr:hypothetical protein [Carboxylicivirga sediminis]MBR8535169.1 hypothetical protein [Carboxylicivirga sediminis]